MEIEIFNWFPVKEIVKSLKESLAIKHHEKKLFLMGQAMLLPSTLLKGTSSGTKVVPIFARWAPTLRKNVSISLTQYNTNIQNIQTSFEWFGPLSIVD